MLKKFTALLIVLALVVLGSPISAQDTSDAVFLFIDSPNAILSSGTMVTIDDSPFVRPFIVNDRTVVPIRFVAENLGCEVKWDDLSREVRISRGEHKSVYTIGGDVCTVNGQEIKLDVVPFIDNERTLVPLRAISEGLALNVSYDDGLICVSETEGAGATSGMREKLSDAPVVGSAERMEQIHERLEEEGYYRYGGGGAGGGGNMPDSAESTDSAVSSDYSDINTQVEGVDEGDIIKTDGKYIYKIAEDEGRVQIIQATPAKAMRLVGNIDVKLGGEYGYLEELYIDGDVLTVIGRHYDYGDEDYYRYESIVDVCVYNIADKTKPKLVRYAEFTGDLISSRKVDNMLYISVEEYPYDARILPCFVDGSKGKGRIEIGYDSIKFFPQMSDASFLTIAAIDTTNAKNEVKVETFLGAGDDVFMSRENIYVAQRKYGYTRTLVNGKIVIEDIKSTSVYKFALNNGNVQFVAKGDVGGTIVNQFSMDEFDDSFRIATTDGWDDYSHNDLYIFDENMKQIGELTDLAAGERIYSVRFMGEKAYIVTFKTIDPLFVIDLSDKNNPKVLGELKIPGYSDYLHPYDENHIIGFGKDTLEVQGNAHYLGMKMAMFDVSDPLNPKEMFSESIGDRGTGSELLYNHKALLFNKERDLLAFPITVCEIEGDILDERGYLKYGKKTFEGAFVYNIDLENGFVKKGEIGHEQVVQRVLRIGEYLYGVSNTEVSAHTLDMSSKVKTVNLQ